MKVVGAYMVSDTGPAAAQNDAITNRWHIVTGCILFTLAGFNLRTVILAVPPVLPLIRHDLDLSYTATGLLTSLPVLVMGGTAWPAGMLASRIGGRNSVSLGLTLLAIGSALRAVWPSAIALYVCTVLLSLGIAIGQTAIPILARQWFPTRIGLVSALFSDGLIIGEAVAAGITVPVVLGILGRDAWRASFVIWTIPVALALVLWLVFAQPAAPLAFGRRGDGARTPVGAHEPAHRRANAGVSPLHLGVVLGSGSLIFFGMNGWIATYNQAIHASSMTPIALVVLNSAQLPVSLGMTPFAQHLSGRRWTFVLAGAICSLAILGWAVSPPAFEILWAALLGGSSSFVFVLGIALTALLAGPEDVARLTGFTLTLSYGVAFIGPLLGGSLWDALHVPLLAFLPVFAAGVALVVLGAKLPPRSAFGLDPTDLTERAHQVFTSAE